MITDILLDWMVPFAREPFFVRHNILKKQTTSIFRKPTLDANSKFL
jgi:hypothetical protein